MIRKYNNEVKQVLYLTILGLFFSTTVNARIGKEACTPGDYYKQTKTLHLYSKRLKSEQRLIRSKSSPYIMKVISNNGWGCTVKLFNKDSKGILTPYKPGQKFIVSYKYFKKGTINTIIKKVTSIPVAIDRILTPQKDNCETLPKESYSNPVAKNPRVEVVGKKQPIQEVKEASAPTILNQLENFANSKEVEQMTSTLKKNCSQFCCYNNCKKSLPYATWCKGKFKRYWNMGIKTKSCDRSLGRCYGYAKLGLVAGGYLDSYMKKKNIIYPWTYSPHAKDSGALLKEAGFTNILTDPKYKDLKITPYNSPKGSILVYGAKKGVSGHIEIVDIDKNGSRKYYSDFVGDKPIADNENFPSLNSYNRPLIGIYIKEEAK